MIGGKQRTRTKARIPTELKMANGGVDTKMTAKARDILAKYRRNNCQGVSLIAERTVMTDATTIGGMMTSATVDTVKVATVDGITMMIGSGVAVRATLRGGETESVTLACRQVIYRPQANAGSGLTIGHPGISRQPATAAPFPAVCRLEHA